MSNAPLLAALALLAAAPFQCGGGETDPASRLEETPGEALYQYAEELEKEGDREGRVRVLRHIVARHPKSRFAQTAREDLRELGELPPE